MQEIDLEALDESAGLPEDDAVYEITPTGLSYLQDEQQERHRETVQRWYDERRDAREQLSEAQDIIGVLMDQFELIRFKLMDERAVEAALLVEEALSWLERVDPDAE